VSAAIASAAATVILSNIVILLSSELEMALPTRSLEAAFIPTSVESLSRLARVGAPALGLSYSSLERTVLTRTSAHMRRPNSACSGFGRLQRRLSFPLQHLTF
jgi:hypothetical protein